MNIVLWTDNVDMGWLRDHQDCQIVYYYKAPRLAKDIRLRHRPVHYSELLSEVAYKSVEDAFRSKWVEILSEDSMHTICGFQYSYLMFPILFWERSIEELFTVYAIENIYISEKTAQEAQLFLDREFIGQSRIAFSEWALRQSLHIASARHSSRIRAYKATHEVGGVEKLSVSKLKHITGVSLNKILLGLDHFIGNLDMRLGGMLWLRKNDRRILLCVQRPKARRLYRALRSNKIRHFDMRLDELVEAIAGEKQTNTIEERILLDQNINPSEVLLLWIRRVVKYYKAKVVPQISLFLDNYCDVLVTDASHHPIIKCISQQIATTRGKKICILPEGAVNAYRQPEVEASLIYIDSHRQKLQLTASYDAKMSIKSLDSCAEYVELIGYNTTLYTSKVIGCLLGFLLRIYSLVRLRYFPSEIVYYEPPFLSVPDFGIVRISHTSSALKLREDSALKEVLASRQCLVISNCRNYEAYSPYPGSNWLHLNLHWSILSACADLLITRDSSIALERLCLMKQRVLVWCPSEKKRCCLGHLEEVARTSTELSYVSECRQLTSEINRLCGGGRRKLSDYDIFATYLQDVNPSNLIEWLKSRC